MKTRAIRSVLVSTLGVAVALTSGPGLATSFRLTDLGSLNVGFAINASGQVTGISNTAGGMPHAFLWDGTTMLDLGTLGGESSQGFAINASGQVTGISDTTDTPHAFLWDGTTMLDLGTPGRFSRAFAINASGQVVGLTSTTESLMNHAFLWDGTAMRDLNDLIDPADPLQRFVTLLSASDINDRGQILAIGVDSRRFDVNSYVVSPIVTVPEPGTLALLSLGLLGLGVMRRRAA